MFVGKFTENAIFNVDDFNKYSLSLGGIDEYSNGDANLDGIITIQDFSFYEPNLPIIGISEIRY